MNISNVSREALVRANPALAYPYMVTLGLCSVIGTLGNILVIISIIHYKELRTKGNVFILNLAIADIAVTCSVDPMRIVDAMLGAEFYDDKRGLCTFLAFTIVIACICSLLSITMISFNRYIYICWSGKYDKIFSRCSIPIMVAGLWIASFLVDVRYITGWGGKSHRYDRKLETCFYDRGSKSYTLLALCVASIGVIAFFYSRIFLFAHRSQRHLINHGRTMGRIRGTTRKSIKLAQTLLVVFVVFFVCWLPYTIVATVDTEDEFPQEIYILAILLTYANSTINWLIYALFNVQFRFAFKRILKFDSLASGSGSASPRPTITASACDLELTHLVNRRGCPMTPENSPQDPLNSNNDTRRHAVAQ